MSAEDKDYKEPFAFLVCLPLSQSPSGTKRIEADCELCGGRVCINPQNNFEGVPPVLKPICGSCMVDLVDGGETMDEIKYSTHLNQAVKGWVEELVKDKGAMAFIDIIRSRRSEYKADNPKERRN